MNHTTSEVLDLAADLIQERGWTTVRDSDPWGIEGGPLCLEGAVFAAVGLNVNALPLESQGIAERCPAFAAVHEYLSEGDYYPSPHAMWRPYTYNDTKGRTAEDVIAVLRAAAAVERVKESAEQMVAA